MGLSALRQSCRCPAWNGETYGSLSQVAKAMTGTSWNGTLAHLKASMLSGVADGIREPKAHFSELVRAAANGELIVLTDYGKPHVHRG